MRKVIKRSIIATLAPIVILVSPFIATVSWVFTNDDISWIELLKEIVNDLVVDPWESA